jgi:hypothetical protein
MKSFNIFYDQAHGTTYTVKKRLPIFQSLAGMSLTKHSLAGNNLIIPCQGEFGK